MLNNCENYSQATVTILTFPFRIWLTCIRHILPFLLVSCAWWESLESVASLGFVAWGGVSGEGGLVGGARMVDDDDSGACIVDDDAGETGFVDGAGSEFENETCIVDIDCNIDPEIVTADGE